MCTECDAGYYKQVTQNDVLCTACPIDTFQDASASTSCLSCQNNSASSVLAASNQTSCKCKIAFSGPDGGICTLCKAGTYKSLIGSSPCQLCPDHSTSPAMSSAATACTCNSGYTGPNGIVCDACAVGTYKNFSGSKRCPSCPAHSTSLQASINLSACLCDGGYVDDFSKIVTRSASSKALYNATFLDLLTFTGLGITKRQTGKCQQSEDDTIALSGQQCLMVAHYHLNPFQLTIHEDDDPNLSNFIWDGVESVSSKPQGCVLRRIRGKNSQKTAHF